MTLVAAYWLAWRWLSGLPQGAPGRGLAWGVWWASFACLTLSAPALVGERVNDALESLNVITVGALLVVGLALWAALSPLRLQTPASSAAPTGP